MAASVLITVGATNPGMSTGVLGTNLKGSMNSMNSNHSVSNGSGMDIHSKNSTEEMNGSSINNILKNKNKNILPLPGNLQVLLDAVIEIARKLEPGQQAGQVGPIIDSMALDR